MKAGLFYSLDEAGLIKLPSGSQLFSLPGRRPVGYDRETDNFVTLPGLRAVAAFASPGHTLTYSAAYREDGNVKPLPLFAYGACAIYRGEVYAAAIKVDNDKRHDSTLINPGLVRKNIAKFKKLFPENRLVGHLAGCAMTHACPNAQNFFSQRYEGPLPTSPSCNAACFGCISYQKGTIRCSQPRIKFAPSSREVAEVALFHIKNAKNPIVSFGQGCEGEPLLEAKLIEESIKMIRSGTRKGTININTNGSKPQALSRLFDAGLDAVRISLNSAREHYYSLYYKPRGYSFKNVIESIEFAKRKGGLVSINYLTMPGFTDSREEVAALERLVEKYRIDMIQWRNLNYDPLLYFRILKIPAVDVGEMMGIAQEIDYLKKRFPKLKMGYFNPMKQLKYSK
ncbi:MAG: radical SAM protein [Candidatus Omnitrophota bacterium]|nr:radical SAM protein [Candidatus Omnitrophota bacterium]